MKSTESVGNGPKMHGRASKFSDYRAVGISGFERGATGVVDWAVNQLHPVTIMYINTIDKGAITILIHAIDIQIGERYRMVTSGSESRCTICR